MILGVVGIIQRDFVRAAAIPRDLARKSAHVQWRGRLQDWPVVSEKDYAQLRRAACRVFLRLI